MGNYLLTKASSNSLENWKSSQSSSSKDLKVGEKSFEAGRIEQIPAMSQTERNASRSRQRKGWRVAWVFVAPFLLLYVLFLVYPAIRVAYLSLTSSDIAGQR